MQICWEERPSLVGVFLGASSMAFASGGRPLACQDYFLGLTQLVLRLGFELVIGYLKGAGYVR